MVTDLSPNSLPFSLVMIPFLFHSTFSTFSHGVSVPSPTPLVQLTSVKANGSETKSAAEFSWENTRNRRSAVEVPIGEPLPPLEVTTTSSLVWLLRGRTEKIHLMGSRDTHEGIVLGSAIIGL
ncbi:uncharacterized protein LOC120136402 [Hibiscus syriacus]|uniref:uncharacterized protein LOC120136402 n=1 Tax=Hibiscus syriacus TaxID=106335 RepID=UPI0019234C5B|nr:uncharacterized protein LOC120136402 [Hibiscus syriacus]